MPSQLASSPTCRLVILQLYTDPVGSTLSIPPHAGLGHGGDNARGNRVTLCAWHHLRGIHRGVVRATGEAPADVTWELGIRPGRRPFLRLHGDRYLH